MTTDTTNLTVRAVRQYEAVSSEYIKLGMDAAERAWNELDMDVAIRHLELGDDETTEPAR